MRCTPIMKESDFKLLMHSLRRHGLFLRRQPFFNQSQDAVSINPRFLYRREISASTTTTQIVISQFIISMG